MGLVDKISIKERGPLLRRDAEPRLHGDVDDLGVVLAAERLIGAELLLQLHERRVLIPLGHLRQEAEGHTPLSERASVCVRIFMSM